MTLFDARGVPVSTRNAESLDRYEKTLAMMHCHRGDALAAIDVALARDPDFVTGHCLRAALLVLAGDKPADAKLGDSLAAIKARWRSANDRERRHAAAAGAWLARNPRRAARLYGDLVIDYPRDILALQLAHAFDFHLGRREMLRDRIAAVLPRWSAGLPGYGFLLTLYAFGLEENGVYERAESIAREALVHSPGNPGAIHVIAHVFDMQGRPAAGVALLCATPSAWTDGSAFGIHNAWHLALFHIDLDEADEALAIYDEQIAASPRRATSALVDASALLWRLSLRGMVLTGRWHTLADCWDAKVSDQHRVFNLAHAMMAFAAADRTTAADNILQLLRGRDVRRANPRDDMRLALPVCEALWAMSRGDYATAVERLTRVRHLAQRCGGSIAQCDLIHLTLVEAALRGRRSRLAAALTAERTARKPGSRLNGLLAARALTALAAA